MTSNGEQLRAWREQHEWTQSQAADAVGYSVETWRSWELGRRAIRAPLVRALQLIDANTKKQKGRRA